MAGIEPQTGVDLNPNRLFNPRMQKALYPLLFHPVYKDYPWGGTRIPETYRRDVPPGIYAESWEISDRDDGMGIVANGPLAGKTIRKVLEATPRAIMGTRVQGCRFPLLIKLIDAREKLSVQVHPDDASAAKYGGEAKTEMWYLLGDNETRVYCGLNDGVTRESFLRAVADGTSGTTMRPVPVRKDTAVFVRGGSVHAIDAGCLILEIQQNSNTTYRIYDWGRMGNDGKPRPLHIEEAVRVIDWERRASPLVVPELRVDTDTFQCWEVLACRYFRLEKLCFSTPLEVPLDGATFHALFVAEGSIRLEWNGGSLEAPAGTSVLVPAALPAYTLAGHATVLRTTVPQ